MNPLEDEAPFTGEYLDFAEMSRDELQAKLFELLTLVETSRELLRAQDANDVARRVLLSSIGVLGASSACVLLRDKAEQRLRLVHQLGVDLDRDLSMKLPAALVEQFHHEGSPRPFRADESLVGGAASSFLQLYAAELAELDADVVCPLAGRSGLTGFLVLGRRLLAEGYTARDLELFSSLAELYVLALERAPRLGAAGQSRTATDTPSPRPHERREGSNATLAELRRRHTPLRKILGESEALLRLFRDLAEFADSRATILLQGESGTGKEVVAKAIHELSRRRSGPLEIVDCSSIPKELIESELFGHVRGAFTGAVRDRRGAFDLAHNGTVFLDEIGEMTLGSQTRLLRVLQEGKFRPVGGEKTHSVDVRVIAATNVDLREAVREGQFRKDLFFRIQVFPLRLPPLREREGDVEVLTRAFLRRFYADYGLSEPSIDPQVFAKLQTHNFPGNVRELQNIAEALAIRSRTEGRVRPAHLEDIFQSMRIRPGQAESGLDEIESQPATLEPARPVATTPAEAVWPESFEVAGGTGELVLRAWRSSSFNLLEASRQLRARRLDGEEIGIVDRVQMSHYLDGEILRSFLEQGGLAGAIERLAGAHPLRHRAVRRARRVVGRLLSSLESGKPRTAFPRLPEEYRVTLERLQERGAPWIRQGLSEPVAGAR